MSDPFIGRSRELASLRAEFARAAPSLVIVYGRRRIGKSTLLREAARQGPEVYYQATKLDGAISLGQFQEQIASTLGEDPRQDGIADWLGTLRFLARLAERDARGLVVTLDEFPYLVEADSALPSVIQKFWDSGYARSGQLKLVLCGSAIAQMQDLLAERNPLYGRKTLALDVGPLSLREAAEFFPDWSDEDRVIAYAIFGGIPYYLEMCDPHRSLWDNVHDLLLTRTGRLVDEPTLILGSEVTDPRRHASILLAVASGCTTLGQIAGRVKEANGSSGLTTYIERLSSLRLMRRENSVDATPRERDSRYVVTDPFLAFWHRFVQPSLSPIGRDHGREVLERRIRPGISEYMGMAFEEICREYVREHLQELTGVPAQVVGGLWGRPDFDLDVAGVDLDGSGVFGECKWTTQPIDMEVLGKLRRRVEEVRYGSEGPARHLLLFGRAGVDPEVAAEAARDPSLHVVSLGDLLRPRTEDLTDDEDAAAAPRI